MVIKYLSAGITDKKSSCRYLVAPSVEMFQDNKRVSFILD